jgi:1-acyl-sn-glycerol-3-phosphate acyltransferase
MAALRSLLFALVFYGGTVPAALASFPISLFGTRALRRWAYVWVRFHRWCARYLLGISTQVEGTPPAGSGAGWSIATASSRSTARAARRR